MEYKEKLQFLYSYIDVGRRIDQLHNEIRGLEDELQSLESHQKSPSVSFDGMPHGSGKSDLSVYMVRREEIIEQIRENILKEKLILQDLYAARGSVAAAIEALDVGPKHTDEYKAILRFRYMEPVNGKPMHWRKIADKMIMGVDTVKHKHQDAVEHLDI